MSCGKANCKRTLDTSIPVDSILTYEFMIFAS
jgi:hypothetical protein